MLASQKHQAIGNAAWQMQGSAHHGRSAHLDVLVEDEADTGDLTGPSPHARAHVHQIYYLGLTTARLWLIWIPRRLQMAMLKGSCLHMEGTCRASHSQLLVPMWTPHTESGFQGMAMCRCTQVRMYINCLPQSSKWQQWPRQACYTVATSSSVAGN